ASHPRWIPDGDGRCGAVAALPGRHHRHRQHRLHAAHAGRLCGGLAGGQRAAGSRPLPHRRHPDTAGPVEPTAGAAPAEVDHRGSGAGGWLAQRVRSGRHRGLDFPARPRGRPHADRVGPGRAHWRTRAGHVAGLAGANAITRLMGSCAGLLCYRHTAAGRGPLQPVAMGRRVGGTPGWCHMNRYRIITSMLWLCALILVGWTLMQMPLNAILDTVVALSPSQWLLFMALNTSVLLALTQRWRGLLNIRREQVSLMEVFLIRQAGQCISFITPGPQFGGEPFQL